MSPLAVITGASGGLGAEFARLCAAKGYDVLAVARSKDALEALRTELQEAHHVRVIPFAADLTDPAAVRKVAEEAAKAGTVELLINNAGFGSYGKFAEADLAHERGMIMVNVLALTELTHLLLPGMLERGSGRIMNIASTAAYQPGPLMAVYYATKAYVLSFSHALSAETRGTGVTVTCVSPGPTRTGFAKVAQLGASKLFRGHLMDATTVARIGLDACLAGKTEIIPGLTNKIGAFATRFASRTLAARIVKYVQGKA